MYNFLEYCVAAYGTVLVAIIVWFILQIKTEHHLKKSILNIKKEQK